jgi:three-Cys-motif partner protein
MAGRNLFRKSFDEGTIAKLKIFEDYFKEWLPVFISKPNPIWKQVQIFDLFAGEGKDVNGIYGSPLRLLKILNDNRELIERSKVRIRVVINEFEKDKYTSLVSSLNEVAQNDLYELITYNEDFTSVFEKYYESMWQSANFLFLDQNGIKQITESIFSKLIKLKQTDFLFFISSSYIKRFAEVEEFQKYLKIKKEDLNGKSYYHIHRIVLGYYRSLIQDSKGYFLAPFSIKKPTGVYGLRFGSNHTYGLEKFLTVCWKHDKLTGEANFDIDKEKIDLSKPSLFEQFNIPSKQQVFEQNLRERLLAGELKTNLETYLFTLNEGFLLKDANIVLKDLKEKKKINFDFPLISSKMHKETI